MLLSEELDQFTGTSQYHIHALGPYRMLLTDGCKHVAQAGEAYWLFDVILSYQRYAQVREQYVQIWQLEKQPDGQWLITCQDWNRVVLKQQLIPYSDFALDTIKILVKNNICLLPSED